MHTNVRGGFTGTRTTSNVDRGAEATQHTLKRKRVEMNDAPPLQPPQQLMTSNAQKSTTSGISDKKGAHGFVSTPREVSTFMNDLLMSAKPIGMPPKEERADPNVKLLSTFSLGFVPMRIEPARDENFYLMPAVGAGDIPLAWLDGGRGLGSGAICCEFSPGNLNQFAKELKARGFTLEVNTKNDWPTREALWSKLEAISNEIGKSRKELSGLQLKREKDAGDHRRIGELKDELGKLDKQKEPFEKLLADPVFVGTLTKSGTDGAADTKVYLFQGDSRRVLKGASLDEIARLHPDKPIVGIENLPWGKNDSMGTEMMSDVGADILRGTLDRSSPGTRSVFILDRTQLSSAHSNKMVKTLWDQGAIVRMFPLPTGTFGKANTSAAVFVFQKFNAEQHAAYGRMKDAAKLVAGEDGEAKVRYCCGLLSSEDMRWATLQKGGSVFSDTNLHMQNRVLSDKDITEAKSASRTSNTKLPLLQFPGRLTADMPNRVEEEKYMQLGEKLIDTMYGEYLSLLHATFAGEGEPSTEQLRQLRDHQANLLLSLERFLGRNESGNLIPRSARDVPNLRSELTDDTLKRMSVGEAKQALWNVNHAISVRMRDAALVHRLVAPSFVTEQLSFLEWSNGHGVLKGELDSYAVDKNNGITGPGLKDGGILTQTANERRPDSYVT